MYITNRTLIRLSSLTLAAFAALSAKTALLSRDAASLRQANARSYSAALEELAFACDGLSASLEKELYVSSAPLRGQLATELYSQSCTAKAALSRLPVTSLRLDNTNKFLSQVGNYSLALCSKELSGEELTDEEYQALSALYDFSKQLTDELWALEGSASAGELDLSQALPAGEDEEPPLVTEGITDFESAFDSYPKLIYDGPFSDNIMEREPRLTRRLSEADRNTLVYRAAAALGCETSDLVAEAEVGGDLPAVRYSDGEDFCEVTKAGGLISSMLRMREVSDRAAEDSEAVAAGEAYLKDLGILSMEVTYYEIQDNVMTINFCYSQNGVRIYPDLAKVMVAMDNCEILGCDCVGYIVNHQPRDLGESHISLSRAQREVSDRLRIEGHRLAVIPTDGAEEKFCWEFLCRAGTGRRVLIYINAQTAAEEQVLLLEESENGTLTR